jgi:ABC-type multidrug transport system fused ATPase/permease subunit
VLVTRGQPLDALLPTLGLFAAAAFRIMPSANKIITAIQIVRNALPAVDELDQELQTLVPTGAVSTLAPMQFRSELTLNDVHYAYPGAAGPALCGVSLQIRAGTTIGIIGGSGAGKSTLVDVILGLLAPERGAIRVDGVDIAVNLRGWQRQIGYVPQSIFLTDDSLRRNIAFGLADAEIDEAAVWRAAKLAQLDDFIGSLPQGLESQVGERGVRISGGQLQRVGIARALYHNPNMLVLDEATSSLDMATERDVMEAIRVLHGEKTIIIVAHRLSTIEQCDQVFRLEAGRIVAAGAAANLIAAAHAAVR